MKNVKALGGYFLLWPLFVASSVVCAPEEQKRWIKGKMQFIGKTFGINQAALLAKANDAGGPLSKPLFSSEPIFANGMKVKVKLGLGTRFVATALS